MITVINASAAVTLLEQRPEKVQALSGIRVYFINTVVECVGNSSVSRLSNLCNFVV